MNKAIKLSIVFGVLLISYSIFYFFIIFIPAQDEQRQALECYTAAKNVVKDLKHEPRGFKQHIISKNEEIVVYDGEYKFNTESKKCLCAIEVDDSTHIMYLHTAYLLDVYTNKTIYSYSKDVATGRFVMGDSVVFNRIKDVLFDETYAKKFVRPMWQKLVKGMSRARVEDEIGKPQEIDYSNKNFEVWIYETGGKLEFEPKFNNAARLKRWQEPKW